MKWYLFLVINVDGNNVLVDMYWLVDYMMCVWCGMVYGLKYVVEGWMWKGLLWEVNMWVLIYDDIVGLDGIEWLICEVKVIVDVCEGDVIELVVCLVELYDMVLLKMKLKYGKVKNKCGKDGVVFEVIGVN